MAKIVLIACVAKKQKVKAKAKDLYVSPLFKHSLELAYKLKPDKIFILSAKHHLLSLNKVIEPYEVTLSTISKKAIARNPHIKILDKHEKKEWGTKVLKMLAKETDLEKDEFIVLAGMAYLEPIQKEIKKINNPLKGYNQMYRLRRLKELISKTK